MARFSLSTSHQRILAIEGFILDLPGPTVTGDDRRDVLSRVDGDNFFVGCEGSEVSDGLTGIVGDDHGFLRWFYEQKFLSVKRVLATSSIIGCSHRIHFVSKMRRLNGPWHVSCIRGMAGTISVRGGNT